MSQPQSAVAESSQAEVNELFARRQIARGIALRNAGQLQNAVDAFWQALSVAPFLSVARFHLSNTLVRTAPQIVDAQDAIDADPRSQTEYRRLMNAAETLLREGKADEALASFAEIGRIWPCCAQLHGRIGTVLWDAGLPEEALVHTDLAIRLRPGWPEALDQAATLASQLGLADRAHVYLSNAYRLYPSDPLAVRLALTLPAIQDSEESIQQTRQRYDDNLSRLLEIPLNIPDPFHTVQFASFYLAYHGLANGPLHSKLANVFQRASPHLSWVADHVHKPRKNARRIKVGFISHFMRSHSIGKTTGGLVEQLSREQFEVYVIDLPPVPEDSFSRWIRAKADHHLTVEPSLEAARSQIAALELDVLFYQDIGMEVFSYYLAFARLARVQCVSYGHPDTTGIPNMDYFISNDLYELPGADSDYTEKLFLLHDLPTLAYYVRPSVPPGGTVRRQFGLNESEHLYVCPQTLFKVHPQFDPIMADILRRDPKGRIVLLRGDCEQWRLKIRERLKRLAPDVADRLTFLDSLRHPQFMRLLSVADAVLDTIHFNGMNSSLEALATGTPVVTLPTSLQRGRHTQAMYRKMQMQDCIASSAEEYAATAVRIGTDSDSRRHLRQTILERNEILYCNRAVTREFERFFTTAVQTASTG